MNTMLRFSKQEVLLHLSLINGVGPATIQKIRSHTQDKGLHLADLYSFTAANMISTLRISQKIAARIVDGLKERTLLEKEIETAQEHQITILTLEDVAYPEELKHIHVPPPVLYVKGKPVDQMAFRLAIVGARASNSYAARVINQLVPTLVANGWHIISGGARGADTMAHHAALEAGGVTAAVFGAGLLHSYPPENQHLFERITQSGGCLISCFPLATRPERGLFPIRNRIISGLCQGTLVVQAAEKSGALITTRYALEQGRHVFAVPGSIHDKLSVGCHNLLKQGAKVVTSAQDILEEYGQTVVSSLPVAGATDDEVVDPILKHLRQPTPFDMLIMQTGKSPVELQARLFELQLEGKVKQDYAGLWLRTE